jgi:hypothetical protein
VPRSDFNIVAGRRCRLELRQRLDRHLHVRSPIFYNRWPMPHSMTFHSVTLGALRKLGDKL